VSIKKGHGALFSTAALSRVAPEPEPGVKLFYIINCFAIPSRTYYFLSDKAQGASSAVGTVDNVGSGGGGGGVRPNDDDDDDDDDVNDEASEAAELAGALDAIQALEESAEQKSARAVVESLADAQVTAAALLRDRSWSKDDARRLLWVLLLVVVDVFQDGDCAFHATWVAFAFLRFGILTLDDEDFDADPQCDKKREKLVTFATEQRLSNPDILMENIGVTEWGPQSIESNRQFAIWKEQLVVRRDLGSVRWLDVQSLALNVWRLGAKGLVVYNRNGDRTGCSATVWWFREEGEAGRREFLDHGVRTLQAV
jgi:hypothetical protein